MQITTVTQDDTQKLFDLSQRLFRQMLVERDQEGALRTMADLNAEVSCLHWNGRLCDLTVMHLHTAWREAE